MQASRAIETGDASVVVVGGVESMSRAPWVLLKPERGYARTNQELFSTTLGWRMVNPEMPEQWTISLGASAEKLAGIHDIPREAQDAWAVRSHRLAAAAWDDGRYGDWVVPVPDVELERDEGIRPDSSVEKLAALKPAFAKDGTVTAANSSSISDGAAALILSSAEEAKKRGLKPIARIVAQASNAQEPKWFATAPVGAIEKVLKAAGWKTDDVDLFEINEAFAVVAMIAMRDLGLPHDKVNVNGGACALGHPIGASGARIIVTLINALETRGLKRGVAALCIGGGEATAVAVELT
jgi:acetyl-CoA acetyltransferase family protein